MATLTGELISETYDSLLKVTDNNTITGVKKRITDGFGNEIPLQLSSTDIEIDGTLILSALTDLEAATKFLSLKADNSVAYRTASEVLTDIGGASSSSISGTTGNIAKFTSSGAVGDSILEEIGNVIHLTDGTSSYASFGIINPGVDNDAYIGSTINNDFIIRVNNTEALRIDTNFRLTIANIQNALADTDKFLVSEGGVVKYRTGAEVLADIGAGVGSVTSVGLTMPVAFSVANSPITSSGTLEVTAIGSASQYIRGDGTLATIPSTSSGGANVNYYLNGSIAASVATYKQMDNSAIIGGGTDFNLVGNGLIAQFLTDAGNPNRLLIPGGAWNFEMYFNISSSGGNSKFYVELLKYDGTTFTSIASSVTVPEEITGGTTTDLYITSLAVPETVLLITDRLALRVYIVDNSGGRTVTLHTEDNTLCLVTTTFAGGIAALNGLTANTQYFATGTTGTDFNISSTLDTHTFNLPTASATNRGALSSANWSTFNGKENVLTFSSPLVRTLNTISIPAATSTINGYLSSTDWTTFNSKQNTITLTTTGSSGAATFISNTLNIPQYTVLSLAAIGITPNANGASIVGSLLSLQPADASFGGVITTGAQTIAGAKSFNSDLTVNNLTVGRGGGAIFSNTAFGINSLFSNTTGSLNTAFGYQAGYGSGGTNANTTGLNNIFIGYNTVGESATENSRTWIGNASTTSTWLGGNLLLGSRTNATSDKLQVTGGATITGILKLGSSDNTFVYESAGSLILQTGASARLTINSAGNALFSARLNSNTLYVNSTEFTFSNFTSAVIGPRPANDGISALWLRPSDASNNVGSAIASTSTTFTIGSLVTSPYLSITLATGAATFSGLITGQNSIYQSNASGSIASNTFETYNAGATELTFKYPAAGSVAFNNGTARLTIASTGAATFSSSVTAKGFIRTTTTDFVVGSSGTYLRANLGASTGNTYGYIDVLIGGETAFGNLALAPSGGNVLINTSTDAGYKLDVNGTGRFSGRLTVGTLSDATEGTANLSLNNTNYSGFHFLDGTAYYIGQNSNFRSLKLYSGSTGNGLTIASTGAATFSSSVSATTIDLTSDSTEQLKIRTLTDTNRQLLIGYKYTENHGYIQAVQQGVGYKNLILNGLGGNVGIGTASPVNSDSSSVTLQLKNTLVLQNVVGIQALFSNNAYYDGAWKRITTATAVAAIRINADTGQSGISFHVANAGTAGSTITNWDSSDIKVRINSSGNVLIGTTTDAGYKLDVNGTGRFTTLTTIGNNTFNNTGGRAIDSVSTGVLFAQNGGAHNIIFGDGNVRYFSLYTPSGAASMSIRNFSTSTDLLTIASTGAATLSNLAGTGSRAVLADANGLLSAPVSDISVKENIKSIGYGLNEIVKMNPVWFDFVNDYKNYGEGRQNGNIAQEMQKIIPEAVFTTPSTGKMGINYDQLHAVYIKAIQELKAEIELLKNK
jgi:hypothetical protein